MPTLPLSFVAMKEKKGATTMKTNHLAKTLFLLSEKTMMMTGKDFEKIAKMITSLFDLEKVELVSFFETQIKGLEKTAEFFEKTPPPQGKWPTRWLRAAKKRDELNDLIEVRNTLGKGAPTQLKKLVLRLEALDRRMSSLAPSLDVREPWPEPADRWKKKFFGRTIDAGWWCDETLAIFKAIKE